MGRRSEWDRPKPRRRWRRWVLRLVVTLLIVPTAGLLWTRHRNRTEGEGVLAGVVARLDADDPDWRLDDLLAARRREIAPDEENSIRKAMALWDTLPQEVRWPKTPPPNRTDGPPSPVLPPAATLAKWAAERAERKPVIDAARELVRFPRGGYQPGIERNPFDTKLPHADAVRGLTDLLYLDALAAAAADNPGRAVSSLRAGLSVGRGLGAEPWLISMLARLSSGLKVTDGLERLLAWSQPNAGLADLQAGLIAEGDTALLPAALRGERAMLDRLFDGLDTSRITLDEAAGIRPNVADGWFELGGFWWWYYRAHLPADRAKMLDLMTQWVAASKQPSWDQPDRFDGVALPRREPPYIITMSFLVAAEKVAAADWRIKARLRCAATAVACERFRQANNRWPDTLAELPKDVLAVVPLDPFDGQPLRYARTADGVVVYSVGPDRTDDGGSLAYDSLPQPGQDVGFRLWDADRRRTAPAPEVP